MKPVFLVIPAGAGIGGTVARVDAIKRNGGSATGTLLDAMRGNTP